MSRLWVRAAASLAALMAAVALLGDPASAHNSFSSSDPKDKAVLDQAPATVSLTFLSRLNPRGTTVSIAGPEGKPAGGEPRFNGPTVLIPLAPAAPGAYTVTYQVASPDGHPITGKITFTLTAKALPSRPPAAGPTASVPAPVTVPSLTTPAPAAVSGVPASGTGDGGPLWWPWALVAGLVAAGAGGFVLARRRRSAG